jgi:hypothetical protein
MAQRGPIPIPIVFPRPRSEAIIRGPSQTRGGRARNADTVWRLDVLQPPLPASCLNRRHWLPV